MKKVQITRVIGVAAAATAAAVAMVYVPVASATPDCANPDNATYPECAPSGPPLPPIRGGLAPGGGGVVEPNAPPVPPSLVDPYAPSR